MKTITKTILFQNRLKAVTLSAKVSPPTIHICLKHLTVKKRSESQNRNSIEIVSIKYYVKNFERYNSSHKVVFF